MSDAAAMAIVTGNRQQVGAQVLGINESADLALIRTTSDVSGHHFQFAESGPLLGSDVAALGFPVNKELSFTKGTVSGLNRQFTIGGVTRSDLIQTDTALNVGNSGGPLLDEDGNVVGVVSSRHLYSDSGVPIEGRSFAVSAPRAQAAVTEWQERAVPIAPTQCGDAPAPEEYEIVSTILSDHDQAANVSQSLLTHGYAINRGAYSTAYAIFTPEMQAKMGSAEGWSSNLSSSYWTRLDVQSVSGQEDALTVRVHLQTVQDAEDGYEQQTCSDWTIDYTMTWDGVAWRIADDSLPAGSPTACAGP
ncbi:hypothetical protein GCM10027562_34410 [Arthrobacter pigmenti]